MYSYTAVTRYGTTTTVVFIYPFGCSSSVGGTRCFLSSMHVYVDMSTAVYNYLVLVGVHTLHVHTLHQLTSKIQNTRHTSSGTTRDQRHREYDILYRAIRRIGAGEKGHSSKLCLQKRRQSKAGRTSPRLARPPPGPGGS